MRGDTCSRGVVCVAGVEEPCVISDRIVGAEGTGTVMKEEGVVEESEKEEEEEAPIALEEAAGVLESKDSGPSSTRKRG